jgi:hypothetical protein
MDPNTSTSTNTDRNMNMNMNAGMSSTFSFSTTVTILFTSWATKTPTQYILTLILLFLLAIFNRFLGALKFQLEQSWTQHDPVPPALKLTAIHSRRNIHKAKLSPLPKYMRVHGDQNEDENIEETLPITYDENVMGRSSTHLLERESQTSQKWSCGYSLLSWRASGRWSLQEDGLRGLLEFARALIGYLL